jgi:SAM-dependent methyltransferase
MIERGWKVTACDISPAMLEIARTKIGKAASFLEADMRELPLLGSFNLIWALNDAMNYLLTPEDLETSLTRMRLNLASGGIVLFDLNTLAEYRTFYSDESIVEVNGRRFIWKGQMSSVYVSPGSISEAWFEAEGNPELTHVHRQRHFAAAEVIAAIEAAGLRCVNVLGESDGDLEPALDEEVHMKAVYLCA